MGSIWGPLDRSRLDQGFIFASQDSQEFLLGTPRDFKGFMEMVVIPRQRGHTSLEQLFVISEIRSSYTSQESYAGLIVRFLGIPPHNILLSFKISILLVLATDTFLLCASVSVRNCALELLQ